MNKCYRLLLLKCLPAALLIGGLVLSALAQAELYRWVDDKGKVHYSDSLPADRAAAGRRVFSSGGSTVEDVQPALTREQVRALQETREAARKERAELQQELQQRQDFDRMLRMTYVNTGQIEKIRDQRLQRMESLVQSSLNRQQRYQQEISQLEQQAARAERSDPGNTGAIYERLQHNRDKLRQEQVYMQRRQSEADIIRDEFAGHIRRFNELNQE